MMTYVADILEIYKTKLNWIQVGAVQRKSVFYMCIYGPCLHDNVIKENSQNASV